MNALILLAFASSAVEGCTCVSQGAKADAARASLIFRGTVKDVRELPARREGPRRRYTVTFAPSAYWKGTISDETTLHVIEPGSDCLGDSFLPGKEYVVFAVVQEARDYKVDDKFWYGWLDVMPAGSMILTGLGACSSTAEVQAAAKTLKSLGKGKKSSR